MAFKAEAEQHLHQNATAMCDGDGDDKVGDNLRAVCLVRAILCNALMGVVDGVDVCIDGWWKSRCGWVVDGEMQEIELGAGTRVI